MYVGGVGGDIQHTRTTQEMLCCPPLRYGTKVSIVRHFDFSHRLFPKLKEGSRLGFTECFLGSWYRKVTLPLRSLNYPWKCSQLLPQPCQIRVLGQGEALEYDYICMCVTRRPAMAKSVPVAADGLNVLELTHTQHIGHSSLTWEPLIAGVNKGEAISQVMILTQESLANTRQDLLYVDIRLELTKVHDVGRDACCGLALDALRGKTRVEGFGEWWDGIGDPWLSG